MGVEYIKYGADIEAGLTKAIAVALSLLLFFKL